MLVPVVYKPLNTEWREASGWLQENWLASTDFPDEPSPHDNTIINASSAFLTRVMLKVKIGRGDSSFSWNTEY
jgi:hypothetical protein